MVRCGLIVLIAAAVVGLIWGFHPDSVSHVGWIFLGIAAVYGLLSVFLPERMLKQRINHREPLAFDEIYQRYFSNLPFSKTLLARVWQEAADDLKLDPQKLRPTDRFRVELAVSAFPLVDTSETLTAHLYGLIPTKQGATPSLKLETLQQYIEFVARLKVETAVT